MAIIYVKSGEMGNGSAWGNALGSLQDALAAASSGDQIWVAAETYTPGSERTSTFELKDGVAIYGGFAGTESNLSQRDVEDNVTILSGDIGDAGDAKDHVYHVVTATRSCLDPLTKPVILDGFTIIGGNADGTETDQNKGGGIFIDTADPILSNLIFRSNNAGNDKIIGSGGAIFAKRSNLILTETLFEFNTADNGAAIFNDESQATIINGTFCLNIADNNGGTIFNTVASHPTVI